MKHLTLRSLILAFVFTSGLTISSCKNKAKDTGTTVDTSTTQTMPVEISNDDVLTRGVDDAIKDHPGVRARVVNGEVYLSGTIDRPQWTKLNQTIQSLSPKKVNSDSLTIK